MHASKMLVLRLSPQYGRCTYMSLSTPGATLFVPLTSHFSRARELIGYKLTSVMKELGSEPLPPPHLYHSGILVHPCTNRGLMNRKNDRIESWCRYIPLENRWGGARCSTGTWIVPREKALVLTFWKCMCATSVLTLNAEPGFLHFKEPGPFKLT